MEQIFLWWSIISTVLGVIFLVVNAGQLVAYVKEKSLILKEKEIHKAQVKVWQHHADGIQRGLFVLTYEPFTNLDDMKSAVRAMQQDAASLFSSLNEERLFTDEEIKERQLQKEKTSQENLAKLQVRQ
jgi:hypothetical protein